MSVCTGIKAPLNLHVSRVFQDENDVYILTKVSDILHSIFSSYREKVLPWFEQLLQLIVNLIVSELVQRSELQLNSACYKLSSYCVPDSVRTDPGQTDSGVFAYSMTLSNTAAHLPSNMLSTSCGP